MFSKKTILEIVKALNFSTHDSIERFLMEFNLDDGRITGDSIKKKETSIAKYLIANPTELGSNGSLLTIEIIEHIIDQHTQIQNAVSFFEDPASKKAYTGQHLELANTLDRDGFVLTDTELKRKLPTTLPIVEKEDELVILLEKFGFSTAKGHYEQAIAAHARGEWAAANAQLRSFVEDTFNEIYNIVCPGNHSSSNDRKIELAKNGFFISNYNEYLFNGTGFVEGFWKRLHPQGSHPGLSEQSDSTFRMHLVILVMHDFLIRLDLRP